mgnify:CR=1
MKKGKFIDYQILLACLSKPPVTVMKEVSVGAAKKSGDNNFKSQVAENSTSFNAKKAA